MKGPLASSRLNEQGVGGSLSTGARTDTRIHARRPRLHLEPNHIMAYSRMRIPARHIIHRRTPRPSPSNKTWLSASH